MANKFISLNLPGSIKRTNDLPLDSTSKFDTWVEADAYIKDTSTSAYVGQSISVGNEKYIVVEVDGKKVLERFLTQDELLHIDGGTATEDRTSIDHQAATIQVARDTRANWINSSRILEEGELAYTAGIDDRELRIGNGTSKAFEAPLLTPTWDGENNAYFPAKIFTNGDVTIGKSYKLVIGEGSLNEEQLKFLTSIKAYSTYLFSINYNGYDITFNHDATDTWRSWCAANTASGLRVVTRTYVENGETKHADTVRYDNAYVVGISDGETFEYVDADALINANPENGGTIKYDCEFQPYLEPITGIQIASIITANGKKAFKLSWVLPSDPHDVTACATWANTRLVYRTDRYPEHEYDVMPGVTDANKTGYFTLTESTTDDGVKTQSYDFENISDGDDTYFFYITPGTTTGFYTEDRRQRIHAKWQEAAAVEEITDSGKSATDVLLGV